MDNNRAMLLPIRADIFKIESLWHDVIKLDCAELPLSAQGILEHKVDLRTVERRFADTYLVIKSHCIGCVLHVLLCLDPLRIFSPVLCLVLGVAERESNLKVIKAQCLGYILCQADNTLKLFCKLLGHQVDMRIILSERTNSRESVKLT